MTAATKKDATKPAVGKAAGQINADTGKVDEAVQPAAHAAVAAPAPATQSKQDATLAKLKEAWTGRGVDLSKLTATPDGKFLMVKVDANWPTIRIGASGGIDLPQIKSYPRAWDAAVEGDKLLAKQNEMTQKKLATPAPKPDEKTAETPKPEPKQTPASKKAAAHKAIEDRMQA